MVYDIYGNILDKPEIIGELTSLPSGETEIIYSCVDDSPVDKRVRITVITRGNDIK
ncbi:MAG TPA: hypothetical protein GX527_08210 [Clostridiaceae bacterium]|nr:hypothetical protein [Clostridiaceae bacterium]